MGKNSSTILLPDVSVLLVVAVVIGAAHSAVGQANGDLDALCSSTYYKDACIRSLSGSSINSSSSPIDVVKATVDAVVKELTAAAENIGEKFGNTSYQSEFKYCKGLFEESLALLQSVVDKAGSLEELMEESEQMQYWLSYVGSLSGSCSDVLVTMDPELKAQIDSALVDTWHVLSNGISIVDSLSKVAGNVVDVELPAANVGQEEQLKSADMGGRKLLNADPRRPSWLSAGDRKLLAAGGGHGRLKPDIVVAKDGSGQFSSINAAVAAVRPGSARRTVIYVKAGIYEEQVVIPEEKVNIYMYGDGGRKTIVTASKSEAIDRMHIDTNPTFSVLATGTVLRSMGMRNTAGPKGHQAVALRVKGDYVVVVNCHITAYQDTLYLQGGTHYFRGCVISGTVDFIFGDSAAVLQKCAILVRKGDPGQRNMVTAQGRQVRDSRTGIVIHDCKILPHQDLFADRLSVESYLGRPWKEYSRVMVMESTIGDLIMPEGYHVWDGNLFLDTLYYGEYANEGPGADTSRRVRWPGVNTKVQRREAMTYTVGSFLRTGRWIQGSGARYTLGLINKA